MSVNYGSKRVVTGAHYGLRDWLAQRVTAALMALFTLGNVAAAIAQTQAPLVDTSSGVESAPGVKDVDKIAAFCKAVRDYDNS